jgi:hypothetical protein
MHALASVTAPARTLAGVDLPGHHRSPPAIASHPKHRLHLAHLALASASHGKAPVIENRSPEHGRAHRRSFAPWTPLIRFTFFLRVARISFASAPRCSSTTCCAVSWSEMADRRAPTSPLRRYCQRARTGAPSARSASVPELPRCGEHDGAHPVAGDPTVGEFSPPVISPWVYDQWGLRSHCQPLYAVQCALHRVDLALLLADLKRILEMLC